MNCLFLSVKTLKSHKYLREKTTVSASSLIFKQSSQPDFISHTKQQNLGLSNFIFIYIYYIYRTVLFNPFSCRLPKNLRVWGYISLR